MRVVTTAQTTELDVQPTPLALLLLGREADPRSERGVEYLFPFLKNPLPDSSSPMVCSSAPSMLTPH